MMQHKTLTVIYAMGLVDPWTETYLQNWKIEELEELTWRQSMYWWQQVKYQKLAHSTRPSKSLRGKKILISVLNNIHLQFTITPGDKFKDQWTMIQ